MKPSNQKKPLYRKVNTRTHGVRHGVGGEYRWQRNTKAETKSAETRGSMHSGQRHGLDYTPLFRFLMSKIGKDWDAVYSEAVSRLDQPDAIFWVVANSRAEGQPFVRVGESKYVSGLFVDEDNRLALVDPDLRVEHMKPSCPCCTHTFNGKQFTQKYKYAAP